MYAIELSRARKLASTSLQMEEKIDRSVSKFSILNALIDLMCEDEAIFKKVLKKIQA